MTRSGARIALGLFGVALIFLGFQGVFGTETLALHGPERMLPQAIGVLSILAGALISAAAYLIGKPSSSDE